MMIVRRVHALVAAARRGALLALPVAAFTACATTRVPRRAPVADPLPLVAGICPGPFDDYDNRGRDLGRAVRERRLFRDVVPLPSATQPDVVLFPQVDDGPRDNRLTILTFVPWVATATVFPWLMRTSHVPQVRVYAADAETKACDFGRGEKIVIRDAPRRQTRAAFGWTAPLLPLLPGWDFGTVYEFRPAVDSLAARRNDILRLAHPR